MGQNLWIYSWTDESGMGGDDDDSLTVVQDASRPLPGPSTCLITSSLRYVGHENFVSIIFKKTR
jgi:hypothetical protein